MMNIIYVVWFFFKELFLKINIYKGEIVYLVYDLVYSLFIIVINFLIFYYI